MQITDYIKPELIVVALVLYFVGMWIKQSEAVNTALRTDISHLSTGAWELSYAGFMCLPQVHAGRARKFLWQYLPP